MMLRRDTSDERKLGQDIDSRHPLPPDDCKSQAWASLLLIVHQSVPGLAVVEERMAQSTLLPHPLCLALAHALLLTPAEC